MELWVNGKRHLIKAGVRSDMLLIEYLRHELRLTGTKLACGEGGCGACTVMLSQYSPRGEIEHRAVNACLTPLYSCIDCHVVTVEAVGSISKLHPVQERMAGMFASQCGFCTPGFVMSLYAYLRTHPHCTATELELEALDGNLCRCTGYRPILDAAKSFACQMGDKCCKLSGNCADTSFTELDTELIYPPQLLLRLQTDKLHDLQSADGGWYRPASLQSLLKLKHEHPQCKMVAGNTEVGIEIKFKSAQYSPLVNVMSVAELQHVRVTAQGVHFGSNMTLTHFQRVLHELSDGGGYKTVPMEALLENLRWFAGRQIRNVATIAGNIATGSPISDLNPVFVAVGAVLELQQHGQEPRHVPMREFFLGYRKTALQQQEVIVSIFVPYGSQGTHCTAFKQSKRRDDDIAIVTAGMLVKLSNENVVEELSLAYGGMGPITIHCRKVADLARGRKFDDGLLDDVIQCLIDKDVHLELDAVGGMVQFRRALAISFFYKFFSNVRHGVDSFPQRDRPVSTSVRSVTNSTNTTLQHVGKSLVHASAAKQVTGTAQYIDDMPRLESELYAALVMATPARARIKSVDATVALAMPGVVEYVNNQDVKGHSQIGPVFKDEELFASEEIYFSGQIVGVIVAESQHAAQQAAKKVRVEYEVLPHILTIEEAISAKSFYEPSKTLQRGDLDSGFDSAKHVVEGTVSVGGQNHFYLETQASIVVPRGEDDEYEVYASTQNPTETQLLVAEVLGIASHKVVCKVKRMGGGFGGKESRSCILTCALAVAAQKTGRPVRCQLDRDTDMMLVGGRHPFLSKYSVGFDDAGKVVALDVQLYSNGGFSADLSLAVMERAVSHSDNCYYVPNIRVSGTVCKTNIHSNTAFRGFGGPQGMMVTETWITHIADELGISAQQVRERNMYTEGQTTHFNQPLANWQVPRLWQECYEQSGYAARLLQVEQFNKDNQWRKRGLAMIPTKFGIAFTARFLNQAGALLHIYRDGSVLLTHGGTEMGQGLHTKCIQIAAEALGIPTERIHISETSTDKVANTSPTAASASSDLNGMAVLDACRQINERLDPLRAKNPDVSFDKLVQAAYFDRVNLSANGFYKTPDLNYDWLTHKGDRMFNYFTFGVAATEVEIDVLTGDHQILRTDLIMDIGQSMNPEIDIGQIEGGFVQGVGWCTIEELHHMQNGALLTRGPGAYKIPSATDIPLDFRVSLLEKSQNTRAIHSSKAIGEPPLFLGSSVFFALREAVKAARSSSEHFRFDSPATADRIRMAVGDKFSKLVTNDGAVSASSKRDWLVRT